MEKNKIKLIAVVGPTASGKTALAVELAKELGGEIVSCDSMQVYRDMPIATAVPTVEERCGITHHMLEFLEPSHVFSVKEYCDMAAVCIEEINKNGKLPILCGGTGLYYRSLTRGIVFSESAQSPVLRAELEGIAKEKGGQYLLDKLAEFDPETAARLSFGDVKRIIRAIEIYQLEGITMSESIRRSQLEPPQYDLTAIGISYHDRQKLYDRINKRVDIMLKNGLLDEARRFFERSDCKTAMQAIGYKELKPYLDGLVSLDEAVSKLKMETRRYAKRQLTWFNRDREINWIYADAPEYDLEKEALDIILKKGGIDTNGAKEEKQ